MPKYFRFKKKNSNNWKDFFFICKKRNILFYLGFVWQKPFKKKIKTVKINLKGCFVKYTLKPKKAFSKNITSQTGS